MRYQPGLHKLVHHLDHLSAIKEGGTVAPIHVSVWPTRKCQLNCDYCMFGKHEAGEELGFEEFKEAIDTLVAFGLKAVEFSGGGEPLLWPHFEDAVKYLTEDLGVKVSLITNGIELDNVTIPTLRRLEWVRISVTSIERLQGFEIEWFKKYVNLSLSYILPDSVDLSGPGLFLDEIDKYCVEQNIICRVAIQQPSKTKREIGEFDRGTLLEMLTNKSEKLFFAWKMSGIPYGCYMPWIRAAIDWRGNFLPCPAITCSEENKGEIPDSFIICHIKDLNTWLMENKPHDLGHRCSFCNCGKEINDFVHEILTPVENVDFV